MKSASKNRAPTIVNLTIKRRPKWRPTGSRTFGGA